MELSLDLGAQRMWKNGSQPLKESTGAKNIGVIVENPSNGEIYFHGRRDRYDLNNPRDLTSLYSREEIKAMDDTGNDGCVKRYVEGFLCY